MSKTQTPSQIEAERKIKKALEQIETAQRLLSAACAELCPITPWCDVWEEVGDLHDKVKTGWHKVNNRLKGGVYDLDPDAKRSFEVRLVAASDQEENRSEIQIGDRVRYFPAKGSGECSEHLVRGVYPNGIQSCRMPMLMLEGKAGVILTSHCKLIARAEKD